jgi:hypothetical protein
MAKADDMLAKMRQKQGLPAPAPLAPVASVPAAKKPAASPKAKSPLTVTGTETLLRDGPGGCGHADQFNTLAGEKPDFREGRLKKWRSKRCPSCAAAHEVEQAAKQENERAARLAKKASKGGGGNKLPSFRLPDGAHFDARYHADKKCWQVILTIPGEDKIRERWGGSLHRTFSYLGSAWFMAQSEEAKAAASAEWAKDGGTGDVPEMRQP